MTSAVSIVHAALVGPLLVYVGLAGLPALRVRVPRWLYAVLLALGLGMFAAHAALSIQKSRSGRPWLWNAVHALVLAPLLAWVGYFGYTRVAPGKAAAGPEHALLLAVGATALFYHLVKLAASSTPSPRT